MDIARVHRVREDMEPAEGRRLQPHYIGAFFLEAFQRVGGTIKQREPRRYEITHVPAPVRNHDQPIGVGQSVVPHYERVAFEKDLLTSSAEPPAAFLRLGKPNTRLKSGEARKRADELRARLQSQMEEIQRERQLAPLPPGVLEGVLVVPLGLIRAIGGQQRVSAQTAVDTQAAAARAREIVVEIERSLGFVPVDLECETLDYDIESAIPVPRRLHFIEVKGRISGADTVAVTKNEILYTRNKPDDFIPATVQFGPDEPYEVRYVRRPFHEKGVTTTFAGVIVTFPVAQLLSEAAPPS